MNDAPYPDSEFPWNFYFNGELMPKWGACWGLVPISDFIDFQKDWDQEVGHKDIYIIYCHLGKVGTVDSADPDVFVYAVQEVLGILLGKRKTSCVHWRSVGEVWNAGNPLGPCSGSVQDALAGVGAENGVLVHGL